MSTVSDYKNVSTGRYAIIAVTSMICGGIIGVLFLRSSWGAPGAYITSAVLSLAVIAWSRFGRAR